MIKELVEYSNPRSRETASDSESKVGSTNFLILGSAPGLRLQMTTAIESTPASWLNPFFYSSYKGMYMREEEAKRDRERERLRFIWEIGLYFQLSFSSCPCYGTVCTPTPGTCQNYVYYILCFRAQWVYGRRSPRMSGLRWDDGGRVGMWPRAKVYNFSSSSHSRGTF
jgi:hypothetical protein